MCASAPFNLSRIMLFISKYINISVNNILDIIYLLMNKITFLFDLLIYVKISRHCNIISLKQPRNLNKPRGVV